MWGLERRQHGEEHVPEFCSQHPHRAAHKGLQLQLQGTEHLWPLRVPYSHEHRRTQTQTQTYN